MKKSKKFWIYMSVYTVFIFCSGLLVSQGLQTYSACKEMTWNAPYHKPGEEKQKRIIHKLSKELSLTLEQQKETQELLKKYQPLLRNIHDEKRARMQSMRHHFDADLIKILTPEQQEKYQALQLRTKQKFGDPKK